MKSMQLRLIIIAFVILLYPSIASAFPFTPSEGDKSVEWFLKGLFGEMVDGEGSNPLRKVLGMFNAAVLCVGGILLAYGLVSGIMNTAHDGEVLGKRWSSMWLPVRTAVGIALMLPINGGYNVIQYLVIWLAMQGVGMADIMTNKVIEDFRNQVDNNLYTFDSSSIKPELKNILKQMTFNSACVASLKDDIGSNAADTLKVFFPLTMASSLIRSDTDLTAKAISEEGVDGFYFYQFGCGSVTFPSKELGSSAENLQIIDTKILSEFRKDIWEFHKRKTSENLAITKSLGQQIVAAAKANREEDDVQREVNAAIDALAESWAKEAQEKIRQKAQKISNDKLLNKMQSDGWLLLGSWYIQMALTQQTLTDAMYSLPDVTVPASVISAAKSHAGDKGKFTQFFSNMVRLASGEKAFMSQDAVSNILYSARVTGGGADDVVTNTTGAAAAKGMLASVSRKFILIFSGVDFTGNDKNPVILASEIGNRILLSTLITATSLAIISGVTAIILAKIGGIAAASATLGIGTVYGVAAGSTAALNITLVAISLLAPIFVALFGAGLSLSYLVPMMPYILWLGAVFGWAVLVVEAVIAAPLWAVTHLSPDNDGIVGRGGQGYMLVLSLSLKPALMVFGFAAALVVMNPVGTFLNETFMKTFFSSVSPGFFGFLRLFAGSVLYTILIITIVYRVFSLIYLIPNGILAWIGGPKDNKLGQEAQQAQKGSGKAIVAATAASKVLGAGMTAGSRLGDVARERDNIMRSRNEKDASTAHQNAGNSADSANFSIRKVNSEIDNKNSNVSDLKVSQNQAAMQSVSAIKDQANSIIARDKVTPNPNQSEVQAARNTVDSIKSSGAESSGKKASEWMRSNSGKFDGTKIGNTIKGYATANASIAAKINQREMGERT